MSKITVAALALSLAFVVACGGGDPCAKLTKDVCGGDDKDCATWVEKDLLEGHKDKKTCEFLTGDGDYKSWLEAAKKSYADSKGGGEEGGGEEGGE